MYQKEIMDKTAVINEILEYAKSCERALETRPKTCIGEWDRRSTEEKLFYESLIGKLFAYKLVLSLLGFDYRYVY